MKMTPKQYEARKRARAKETLDSLRQPSRYWIRDVNRDLKPRTLKQVFAENRRGREVSFAFVPKQGEEARQEYLAWAKRRGHTPHPASLDWDHPFHTEAPERLAA